MPVYEYECNICKRKIEVKEKIGEPKPVLTCPNCGILDRRKFEKLMSRSTFRLNFKPFH